METTIHCTRHFLQKFEVDMALIIHKLRPESAENGGNHAGLQRSFNTRRATNGCLCDVHVSDTAPCHREADPFLCPLSIGVCFFRSISF